MKRALTILFLLFLATTARGQSSSQLFAFACNPYPTCPHGTKPQSIIQASDGNLYGVNSAGGPNSASSGTIFKISKTGTGFQVLQTFCTSCTAGANPNSLLAGSDGNCTGPRAMAGASIRSRRIARAWAVA